MECVIVTGMSGAGKSLTLKYLEDIGFFCVDNLPPALLPTFVEICTNNSTEMEKVALGIDIRGGKLFGDPLKFIGSDYGPEVNFEVLYLDADDKELIKRYKETRRMHPLMKGGTIQSGIIAERELLQGIKERADYIIDTSGMLTRQLKAQINEIFMNKKTFNSMIISVMSFGFKYGIPPEADLVFDVRFLPNPFYIPEMRNFTGKDKIVSDFVLKSEEAKEFSKKLCDMIEFLIPNYKNEGKTRLVIAFGCTGGKHRSVTFAVMLYNYLTEKGYSTLSSHRDIDKDSKR
ncbi:MAG: RNase adapter RapZ [Clostridiales bacterium]|nr:RNase adapter RapZ [Clostridiales bacterium]